MCTIILVTLQRTSMRRRYDIVYNVYRCKENKYCIQLREKNNFISNKNQSCANRPRDFLLNILILKNNFALMLHIIRYDGDNLIDIYDVFLKTELIIWCMIR